MDQDLVTTLPKAKIEEVRKINPRIACQLDLQRVFGLRPLEARRLKPYLADKGSYLDISLGTKGKRSRVEAITTAEQREVLEIAKTYAFKQTDSVCTPGKTLKQAEGEYYRLLRKVGVTKAELGVTSYANRHQFANDKFEELTGIPSPVRGGPPVPKEIADLANLKVAESLGHSRAEIVKHYLGSN